MEAEKQVTVPKDPESSQKRKAEDNNDQPQASWQQQVVHLTQEIANDCNLKKGMKTKFIKHAEQAAKMWNSRPSQSTPEQIMLMAGLYKNLGKLGEHEQSLQKALTFLKEVKGASCVVVRWTLQLIAFKSSAKKREQCYQLALKTLSLSQKLLKSMIQTLSQQQKLLAQLVLEISEEETKDEVIWLYNDRNMADDILLRLRKMAPEKLALPFYHQFQFHIADVMTLQSCRQGWQNKHADSLRELAIYISICCFTLATEKYYLKDYTQKCNHIKALKIALAAFQTNCTYVAFLTKILEEHFGKNMSPITQEHHIGAETHELMYYLPKEKKEVALLDLTFADE